MAIVYNGTKNSLPDRQIPTGYTRPTVTEITGSQYESTLDLTITKATVQSATRSTTMTNIFNDATVGINKQIEDILGDDYLDTANVTAHGELLSLSNNLVDTDGDDAWLSNTAAAYTARVKVYIKAL